MDKVEIFTDGACRGNPGPGGWGVVIKRLGSVQELKGAQPSTTNNRMELMAAIEGLRALASGTCVDITTDSQYVKKGITEWINTWKRKAWRNSQNKAVANADLWRELDAEAARHRVNWHWVKGHSGHPDNERADCLANLAIDEMLQGVLCR